MISWRRTLISSLQRYNYPDHLFIPLFIFIYFCTLFLCYYMYSSPFFFLTNQLSNEKMRRVSVVPSISMKTLFFPHVPEMLPEVIIFGWELDELWKPWVCSNSAWFVNIELKLYITLFIIHLYIFVFWDKSWQQYCTTTLSHVVTVFMCELPCKKMICLYIHNSEAFAWFQISWSCQYLPRRQHFLHSVKVYFFFIIWD